MNEDDENTILDLFKKYDNMKETKAKEEADALLAIKINVDEQVKERVDEITLKLEDKFKADKATDEAAANVKIDVKPDSITATKDTESFNAVEIKDDGYVSIQRSKEFVSHICSRTLANKGMDVKPNSIVAKPYEQMMAGYEKYGIESFLATDANTDCDDGLTEPAWERADCFVDSIMYQVICKSDILGRVGHRKFVHDMGCGGQVQIKTINIPQPAHDWGDSATLNPCECITCVSNLFSTYTVPIKKYGDYRVICNAAEILSGDLQGPVMQTMAARLAERIDNEIMTNLKAAVHVYSASLGVSCAAATRTTNCCEWTIDLWDAIMELEADMRAGGYFANSDPTLLIHPDVAVYLKYRNGLSIPPWMIGSIQMDGTTLTKIGNIKVIETCHMDACSNLTQGAAGNMALLIDPDRAFAEVWAQKPKFKVDDDPIECDSKKLVVWAYAGFNVLDPGAIGVISNP